MLPFLARTFLLLAAAFSLGALGGRATRPKRRAAKRSGMAATTPMEALSPQLIRGEGSPDPAEVAAGEDQTPSPSAAPDDGFAATAEREPTDETVPKVAPPAFASYGGSGVVAGVILTETAAEQASHEREDDGDPALLAAPDARGRTPTAEERGALPDDPLAAKHETDVLDFRTVDYGNAKAAERMAAVERSRDDGWTVPENAVHAGRAVHDESPAAFKSGGGSGAVHGAPALEGAAANGPLLDADPSDAAAEPVEAAENAPRSEPEASAPSRLETARDGAPDDLTRIYGIGPSIERLLFDNGVFHFDQIANWSSAEARWADDLTGFRGRVSREKWIDQARALLVGEPAD